MNNLNKYLLEDLSKLASKSENLYRQRTKRDNSVCLFYHLSGKLDRVFKKEEIIERIGKKIGGF
jgi:hypothetical protein